MADKKYYWFKLKDNFFDQHEVRIIEKRENGAEILLFYIKLLTESITHNGELRFSKNVPYSIEDLATLTGTKLEVAQIAMDLFKTYELITEDDAGTYKMMQIDELIGFESAEAERKREYRSKTKTKFNSFEQRENSEDIYEKLMNK